MDRPDKQATPVPARRTGRVHPARRRGVGVAAALVLVLLAAACSSSAGGLGARSGASATTALHATLNGSGSTFQMPFDQAEIAGFATEAPGVTIDYAGGGSGKGKQELANGVVDFAGSDSLVKAADKAGFKGGRFLYFPTVVAPITVSYNLPVNGLKLDGATLAAIFTRTVTRWNDPAIARLNPGEALPDTAITVVHRADASGTTSNFTAYLTAAGGQAWTLGSSDTINWPAGTQAGQGNAGVAQIIKSTDGAIGYVDFSDAVNAKLTFAAVQNRAGSFEQPTLKGASAAAGSATVAPDLTYTPIDAPGAGVYPITSPTWILVYVNQTSKAKGDALKAFLRYVLTTGQQLAEPSSYAPLPEALRQKALAQLAQITVPAS